MTRFGATTRRLGLALAAAVVAWTAAPALGQASVYDTPKELEAVGIDERLGETVPRDVVLTDHEGRTVTLGDLLGAQPVIITPVFYNCPQLCTLVLNGMVAGLNDLDQKVGVDYRIVTFSFDHTERWELAEVKRRAYLAQYDVEGADEDAWRFHVADEANVKALCGALGFYFNPLEDGTIAHSASIMFITPDGRISRYMNDVNFEPRDLELALVEASEGTIGSPMDRFLLFNCFVFDPDRGSFVVSAWKLMRMGGALTMLFILVGVIYLLWRGPKNPLAARRAEDLSVGGLPS